MSVGTVRFYRLRGSLSSGEYPLFTAVPSSSPVATFPDVLYRGGLQASVDLPYFSGMEEVNVASIGADYYWVTEYRERTADAKQYTFTLDYMAPTSLLREGQSVDMCLTRSPNYMTPYLSDDYSKGATQISSYISLGNRIYNPYTTDEALYWVQITCQFKMSESVEFRRYGCFVVINRNEDIPDVYLDNSCYKDVDGTTYPSLSVIMNHPDSIIPSTASAITDISISRRCPYKYIIRQFGQSSQCINLMDIDDAPILAGNDASAPKMYFIDNLINREILQNDYQRVYMEPTLPERLMGRISIRDWNRNIIATFPIGQSQHIVSQTYADLTGIYTIVSNEHQTITIPEGKLPWVGSEWSEYKAYQMDTDRQMMAFAQQYAAHEFETRDIGGGVSQFGNALNNMIFGAIAGKGAGAIAGGIGGALNMWASGYENERAYALSMLQAQDTYELSQIQAKNSRGTAYGVGYGLIYVALTAPNDNLIAGFELPCNDAEDLFNDYTARYGYPCEGRHTFEVQEGFYKGFVPSTSTLNGMRFDELNRTMMNGFKFVRS